MHGFRRLLEPPRLRTLETTDGERRATWLELFFDLVFVVTIARLSEVLTDHPTTEGYLQFVGLFVPVWWAWAGFTFYANRFDTDDLVYRVLSLVGMFAVAAVAITVTGAVEGGSAGFAVAYISVRLAIIALYARAIRHVETGRPLAQLYFAFFSSAVGIWLVSLAVAAPLRYWLWALALAVELSAPLFGWRLIPLAPISQAHIPERFGLLTIIVLGESVFAVVLGVADTSWEPASVAAAAAGFLAAAAIWWIYFEFLDASLIFGGAARRRLVGGLTFTYAHFPVVVGIASLGVGVKFAILSAAGEGQYDTTGWVVCLGVVLCMLGMAAIQLATPPTLLDRDVWLRLGTAAAALALLPLSDRVEPLLVLGVLSALLAAQVVYELGSHDEHGAPTSAAAADRSALGLPDPSERVAS